MDYILRFDQISAQDLPLVGGKNASLGEMIRNLHALQINVPDGFATTTKAYHYFLDHNQLTQKIAAELKKINYQKIATIEAASKKIQTWILKANFPSDLSAQITKAYKAINKNKYSYAVRSSATAEDLPDASFAGQQDTYLNVSGIENILAAIKKVYASLFTARAISYRSNKNIDPNTIGISAGIQHMVRSDVGASGVMFTIDTESGFDQVIFITASYGLGETIVQGTVNPDEFYLHKPMLRNNFASIISRKCGSKKVKMVYANSGKATTRTIAVPQKQSEQFCLSDEDLLILGRAALAIEKHYQRQMDIEWAKDGLNNKIYILQARPETVETKTSRNHITSYELKTKGKMLISGRSIGHGIGSGIAKLLKSPKEMHKIKEGDILVTDMTDPNWEPIMKKASAIITNRGGRTCHAAIIAREMGIPAIVGTHTATQKIKHQQVITASCAEGETGFVYAGKSDYTMSKTELSSIPKLKTKLCLNLANPEQAFNFQYLPNDGIGLARLEFIIGNTIGIHPNALLNYKTLSAPLKKAITQKTAAYKNPIEFYVEKLTEGIGTIAAAFHPKPIIVRFSDFKSNEYADLLGGREFEPKEENPMLGYRGASRYLSGNFTECFLLEIQAMKRVREKLGLTNAHVMFPFVRTVEQAKQLITLLDKHGLSRSKDSGLKIYMMCEVPSNVILAEEFLQHFDGYSIGSNDLTQLLLGLDRDSQLISGLFDERDTAVKNQLAKVIETCKRLNKYVGICGQAPSDHPDLAHWLVEQNIDSLSLTPDTITKTFFALGDKSKSVK